MNNNYPNLLSPYKIRNFTYKNRILLAPMWGAAENRDGILASGNVDFYETLAKNGVAATCTGDNPVNLEDAGYQGEKRTHFYTTDPDELERLRRSIEYYAEKVHKYGTIGLIEFTHMGQYALEVVGKTPMPYVYGPNDGIRYFDNKEIRAFDEAFIEKTCEEFALCAERAKSMGLDGILVHGGHGVLMGQCLSKKMNQRTDEYGGSIENRSRFPKMILQRIRDRVGDDFLIHLRLSGIDYEEGGITTEDTVGFCEIIDGIVDVIQISGGIHHIAKLNIHTIPTYLKPPAANAEVAAAVKKVVKKSAVDIVGGINDPDLAEELIATGKTDFVSMARQLTSADQAFVRKLMQGHPERINTCLRCLACGLGCVNYTVEPMSPSRGGPGAPGGPGGGGGSQAITSTPAFKLPERKDVVVVGGGPAGMRAAITAAEQGHDVVLIDKGDKLGGTINFAEFDQDKIDILKYRNNMVKNVESRRNIRVKLNTEATPEMVAAMNADAVIVAIGAATRVPNLPGVDGANVFTAIDAFYKLDEIGKNVAVIGGGLSGCETAVHLAHHGRNVTVIGRNVTIAPELKATLPKVFYTTGHEVRFNALAPLEVEFEKYNVKTYTSSPCKEITDKGVRAFDADGNEFFVEADSIVYAIGYNDNIKLANTFIGTAPLFYNVGDSYSPGRISSAVRDGYKAALDID